MQTNEQVEKIILYLEGKIEKLKQGLQKFESPIIQDLSKNSPHLQMEYTRLSVELQTTEDNLLAIKTFSQPTEITKAEKTTTKKKAPGKANKNGQSNGGKEKQN